MRKEIITAKEFFYSLGKKMGRYKLINGLFIVGYLNKDVCAVVGDFLKAGDVFNRTNKNKVQLVNTKSRQLFCPKRRMVRTSLGYWHRLNLAFNEQPIGEILK